MTYDNASVMAAFVGERSIGFPMLRDIDGKHVDAWGIRNEDYGPGTFGYGIPHPGLVWISADGVILAKWALRGYKDRADWKEVLVELAVAISAKSETR